MNNFLIFIGRLSYYGGATPTKKVLGVPYDERYCLMDLPMGCSIGHFPTQPRDVDAKTFAEDAKLLLEEGVTYGLRSPWMRRVAVPIIMAYRHMHESKSPERFSQAREILNQCLDGEWRERCSDDVDKEEQFHKDRAALVAMNLVKKEVSDADEQD